LARQPRTRRATSEAQEAPSTGSGQAAPADEPKVWLRADYACHVFHYRMPETVAIASVNPVVPSPLTVKMAPVAALFRDGRVDDAEQLAPRLPDMQVMISPPESALVFRALLRYVRPPADRGSDRIDANTGGRYGTNPHNREFALWGGPGPDAGVLSVFVNTPQSLAEVVEAAMRHVSYLGAKDSLVTCLGVEQEAPDESACCKALREGDPPPIGFGSFVVRLADLRPGAQVQLRELIPSQRGSSRDLQRRYIPNAKDQGLHVLPGTMASYGRVKFYNKSKTPDLSGRSSAP
jgi:hypothetical protein